MAKNKDVKKDVSHKKKDIEAEHTNPESRHDSIETERTINTNGLRNLLIEATPLNSSADEPQYVVSEEEDRSKKQQKEIEEDKDENPSKAIVKSMTHHTINLDNVVENQAQYSEESDEEDDDDQQQQPLLKLWREMFKNEGLKFEGQFDPGFGDFGKFMVDEYQSKE